MWAIAKVEMKVEGLFEVAGSRAQAMLARFKGQEMVNTVWAFATLGVKDEELFRAAARQAMGKIGRAHV